MGDEQRLLHDDRRLGPSRSKTGRPARAPVGSRPTRASLARVPPSVRRQRPRIRLLRGPRWRDLRRRDTHRPRIRRFTPRTAAHSRLSRAVRTLRRPRPLRPGRPSVRLHRRWWGSSDGSRPGRPSRQDRATTCRGGERKTGDRCQWSAQPVAVLVHAGWIGARDRRCRCEPPRGDRRRPATALRASQPRLALVRGHRSTSSTRARWAERPCQAVRRVRARSQTLLLRRRRDRVPGSALSGSPRPLHLR